MLKSMNWLPTAPHDFRDQIRALQTEMRGAGTSDLGLRLFTLANHALDENQLTRLARLAAEGHAQGVRRRR